MKRERALRRIECSWCGEPLMASGAEIPEPLLCGECATLGRPGKPLAAWLAENVASVEGVNSA